MFKIISYLIVLIVGTNAYADGGNGVAAQARVAELASHRIEKLVSLKKIDSTFVSKLQLIEVQKLSQSQSTDPYYLSTVSQVSGQDGTKNQVELYFDIQGKVLSYVVKNGTSSTSSPTWPTKDPSTLIENGLHYLLDHGSEKQELKPFYESLLSLEIVKSKKDNFEVALLKITSRDTQKVLNIYVKLDGTFYTYEIE